MNTTDIIHRMVEAAWDSYDEYMTEEQRKFLESKNMMQEFADVYFEDLVERYRGTCNFLMGKDEDFLEEFDMYQAFDEQIFSCVICGWWYDDSEQGESNSGDLVCDECAKDEEK